MNKIELNKIKLAAEREGMVIQSKNGAVGKLIKYNSACDCKIEVQSGYTYTVEYSKFIRGQFRDPFIRNVYSVGYFGSGKYNSNKGGEYEKAHKVWNDVLKRCYSEKEQARYPTYKGCLTDERWHCYQDFAEWYVSQKGAFNPKWAIDKDLIDKHNKIYGPDKCFLLPPEVNGALLCQTRLNRMEDMLPMGVMYRDTDKKYTASKVFKNKGGKRIWLGSYDTKEEAFNAYKKCREDYMKELANKYKGQIEDKAYELLMNWTITIED